MRRLSRWLATEASGDVVNVTLLVLVAVTLDDAAGRLVAAAAVAVLLALIALRWGLRVRGA